MLAFVCSKFSWCKRNSIGHPTGLFDVCYPFHCVNPLVRCSSLNVHLAEGVNGGESARSKIANCFWISGVRTEVAGPRDIVRWNSGSPSLTSLADKVLSLIPCFVDFTDLGYRDTSLHWHCDWRSQITLLVCVESAWSYHSPPVRWTILSSDSLVYYET